MKNLAIFSAMLIFCTLTLLLMNVPSTNGRAFRVDKLPDKGKNWGCATCHTNPAGGGARNDFGKDYQQIALPAGDRYTKALGEKDSDSDGFTNDQEFDANPPTEPWNANSKPQDAPQAVVTKGKRFVIWAEFKKKGGSER